jgi:hypothetical protein
MLVVDLLPNHSLDFEVQMVLKDEEKLGKPGCSISHMEVALFPKIETTSVCKKSRHAYLMKLQPHQSNINNLVMF